MCLLKIIMYLVCIVSFHFKEVIFVFAAIVSEVQDSVLWHFKFFSPNHGLGQSSFNGVPFFSLVSNRQTRPSSGPQNCMKMDKTLNNAKQQLITLGEYFFPYVSY